MVFVFPFDYLHDTPPLKLKVLLGGKGANLAEMTSVLGLPVPPGFTITTERAGRGSMGLARRTRQADTPAPRTMAGTVVMTTAVGSASATAQQSKAHLYGPCASRSGVPSPPRAQPSRWRSSARGSSSLKRTCRAITTMTATAHETTH